MQEYQRALQLDPRSAGAVIGLADSYDSAGRAADAETAYRKAIALRPDSWDGYNNLGIFLDEHQRYDEAIADFRKEIAVSGEDVATERGLAAAYKAKGMTAEADAASQMAEKAKNAE